jgi:hypothetical protein
LLNDHWVIEEIREEIKKFLEVNENNFVMGHSKGSPNRKGSTHECIY